MVSKKSFNSRQRSQHGGIIGFAIVLSLLVAAALPGAFLYLNHTRQAIEDLVQTTMMLQSQHMSPGLQLAELLGPGVIRMRTTAAVEAELEAFRNAMQNSSSGNQEYCVYAVEFKRSDGCDSNFSPLMDGVNIQALIDVGYPANYSRLERSITPNCKTLIDHTSCTQLAEERIDAIQASVAGSNQPSRCERQVLAFVYDAANDPEADRCVMLNTSLVYNYDA